MGTREKQTGLELEVDDGWDRVRLRAMVTTDAEAILKIYEEGIQTGHATFEAEVPDWQKWDFGLLTQCRWLAE